MISYSIYRIYAAPNAIGTMTGTKQLIFIEGDFFDEGEATHRLQEMMNSEEFNHILEYTIIPVFKKL